MLKSCLFWTLSCGGTCMSWKMAWSELSTQQIGCGFIMVWETVFWHELGILGKTNLSLKGNSAYSASGWPLLSSYGFYHPNEDGMFQDKNIAGHWAHVIRSLYEENSGRTICFLRSPEMNLIEHIWDMLFERVIQAEVPTAIPDSWAWITVEHLSWGFPPTNWVLAMSTRF